MTPMNRTLLLLLLPLAIAQAASSPPPTALVPAGTVITNQALGDHLNDAGTRIQTASNTVTATVQAVCAVTVTPPQQRRSGIPGEVSTFELTVTNHGNAPFDLTLNETAQHNAQASLSLPDRPTVQDQKPMRLTLGAGEGQPVLLHVLPRAVGEAAAQLTATCPDGTQASGTVTVDAATLPLTLEKVAEQTTVRRDEALDYVLTVRNPNLIPVTVTVQDTLDPHLTYVSSQPAASRVQGQTVVWEDQTIPAQGQVRFRLTTRVSTQTDEATIPNTAVLRQPGTPDTPSNTVTTTLFDPTLRVLKQGDRAVAQPGQTAGFTLTLTNASEQAVLTETRFVDTLPPGQRYVAGSGQLNGQAAEPRIQGQVLTWTAPGLTPGQRHTVTYRALVGLSASGTLTNVVDAGGRGAGGTEVTKRAQASLQVLASRRPGDLIGVVFVDDNGDGVPQATERPVAGARVLLAGGRETLTDEAGRFHFMDLPAGPYALTLDPATVPLPPSPYPGDQGVRGARLIQVLGLTQSNIPLEAPALAVTTDRQTTLTAGPVTLQKRIRLLADGRLESTTLLRTTGAVQVAWTDRLPDDASEATGESQYRGPLTPETPRVFIRTFRSSATDPLGDPELVVQP